MINIYKSVRLEDLVEDVIDYRGKTPPNSPGGGIPVISAAHVKKGKVVHCGKKFVSPEVYEKWTTRGFIKPNDILITTEAPVAEVAKVPSDRTYLITRRVIALQIDNKKASNNYVYYLLTNENIVKQLKQIAHGSTVPRLYKDEILSYIINLPPLPTQKKIAHILSTYDDLIENNQQRIAVLEQMAQNLYKEWFVRLRFPGYEKAEFVDGLPKGWEKLPLEEVVNSLNDGDWIETKDQGGEDFRLLQISNIGRGKFIETKNWRYITKETFHRLNCQEVKSGDILVSRMPNDIGRAWLVTQKPFKIITAVDVAIIQPNKEVLSPYILINSLNSEYHIKLCETKATGTTRKRISRKVLGEIEHIVPSKELQIKYESIAKPISEQIQKLREKNELLKQQRDKLLPRLLSGKLEV